MLAEVLAAVALVAIGLSALASAIPVAGAAVSEGAKLSTATFLAGARLEEVRAARVERGTARGSARACRAAPLSPPQNGGTTTFADEAALPDPYAGYSRQVRILDCGLPPGCGAVISGAPSPGHGDRGVPAGHGLGPGGARQGGLITTLVAQR